MGKQATRWEPHSGEEESAEAELLEFSASSIPLVGIFERPYSRPQQINLKFMGTRPQIAHILADTFWLEMASVSEMTRANRMTWLRALFAFLDWEANQGIEVESLRDFTFELLGGFSKWLIDQRGLSEESARSAYLAVAQHLRAARRLHPKDFEADFAIPSHGFGPAQVKGSDSLDPDIFAKIVRAAETGVKAIQDDYCPGNFPTSGCDLIPFMIVIAANTAMNAFSLYQLKRNCLEPHPLDDHAVYLRWKKARSSMGTQRQLHKRTSRTIALINFLLEYTKPLVERVPAWQREFLFLYQYGHYLKPSKVTVASMHHWSAHQHSLTSFCETNSLPHFTFGQIRPSAATHNHLMNGGNLRKTQMLLGHKSIETTVIYIDKIILKPLYDKSMRAAQEAIVDTIRVIPKPVAAAISEGATNLSRAQRKSIINGEFN